MVLKFWSAVSVEWLIDERHYALFPVGTIAKDSHHSKSLPRYGQDLNLRKTQIPKFLKEAVQQY